MNRPKRVFLMSEASMLNWPGPRIEFRAVSPYVAVVSAGDTKHEVSNHFSTVGLLNSPPQIWFGRLPVPVERTPCAWVTVNGRPVRQYTMPLACHPPYNFSRAHGIS